MKLIETKINKKQLYFILMIFCFLYGGFSIFTTFAEGYSNFWRSEIVTPRVDQNVTVQGQVVRDLNRPPFPERVGRDPLSIVLAPFSIIHLIGGIISILAGIAIFSLLKEKEIKKIKQETADHLLLPEERRILEVLKKTGFESTQSYLVKETGLTRVQVHRTIQRLESKGILEKHPYGLTNKIVLKKEVFE